MFSTLKELEQEIRAAKSSRSIFTQFSPELESEFRKFRHARLLKRVPIIGISGLCLFTLFAILDIFILPEQAYAVTTCIRLFLICPLIAIAMLAAKQSWPHRIFSWYYLSAYTIAGLGIVAIIFTARINDFALPYDGVLLHLVFGYFLMGMPYKLATLGGIAITTGYIGVEMYLNTPQDQLASNALFICTLNVMGCMGSYMHDRSRRHLFLNKKLVSLALKKDELEIESKTKLVATASHDLRQPLHAMNILVEALEAESQNHEATKLTLKLKESLRQLSQLLTSLLDISRFNAKIVEYHPVNLELASTIKTMLHNQLIRAKEVGIEIKEVGPSPCFVKTDPVLLERVFRNLCENIYQHANATLITISWEPHHTSIRLKITDNGKGINQEDQDKIFDEFHKSSEGSKMGMGLGLSIVKQSCDIMGSKIGVNSSPGNGATFWIDLKQAHINEQHRPDDNNEIIETASKTTQRDVARKRVLVVSDDHDLLDSYTALFTKWGYLVKTKASPEGALNLIEKEVFDLLISDIQFTQTQHNGIELLAEARKKSALALPAILMTANENLELNDKVAENFIAQSDITELVLKPLTPAKLKLMLKHLC